MVQQEGVYKTVQHLDLNIYYIFYMSIIAVILAMVQLNLMTKTQNPIVSILFSYVILFVILKVISMAYNKYKKIKFINQNIL
jgi:putative effector of murein hydrolase